MWRSFRACAGDRQVRTALQRGDIRHSFLTACEGGAQRRWAWSARESGGSGLVVRALRHHQAPLHLFNSSHSGSSREHGRLDTRVGLRAQRARTPAR